MRLNAGVRGRRKNSTQAEDALWRELRGRKLLGLKFRRQHALGRFVVDFYCREAKLVIEVDGEVHDGQRIEDAVRQAYLESLGLRVLRFKNERILLARDEDLESISSALRGRGGRRA